MLRSVFLKASTMSHRVSWANVSGGSSVVRRLSAQASSGSSKKGSFSWVDRHAAINSIFKYIIAEPSYKIQCKEMFIDYRNWYAFLNESRRALIKDPDVFFQKETNSNAFQDAIEQVAKNSSSSVLKTSSDVVFNFMLRRAEQDMHHLIIANRTLSSSDNLSKPHLWYPLARMMKRKIIYNGGPTNSGKTYHAIERLKNIDPTKGGGVYCGPLRLLALEVYDKLNKAGVMTNLRTGQENRSVPGAYHTSSTVEMVSLTNVYDVAVIDEIQMIGDRHRGSAWTRALLGLRANEIHVCGGLEAADLVRSLCETTGDEFILNKYERLSPVEVESESLRGDYSKVQPGDCIVAFAVQDLFLIRREIESKTRYKCAIINGKLPSETKSNQAKLFNENGSGYDILIATDAIGMGLNLNIRRIIFHSTLRRNGVDNNKSAPGDDSALSHYHVDPILVKQIAGRAGRKSSNFNIGKVTTWQEFDLAYVRAVMQWDIPQIAAAGIAPDVAQIQLFYEQIKQLLARNDNDKKIISVTEVTKVVAPAKETISASDDLLDEILTDGEHTTGTEDMLSISAPTETASKPSSVQSKKSKSKSKKAVTESKVEEDIADAAMEGSTLENSIMVAESVDNIRLSMLVERFLEASSMDSRYFMCNLDSLHMISNFLHPIPMTVSDRFTFASAPTNIRSASTMQQFYVYAAMYALNRPVLVGVKLRRTAPKTLDEFVDLCEVHNTIDLYLWLCSHFPKTFLDYDNALNMKLRIVQLIEEYLSSEWAMSSARKGESLELDKETKRILIRSGGSVHASVMAASAAYNSKTQFRQHEGGRSLELNDDFEQLDERDSSLVGALKKQLAEQDKQQVQSQHPIIQAAVDAQLLMSKRYLDLRNKLLGRAGTESDIELLLPPFASDLRDITKRHLEKISVANYYVEPSPIFTVKPVNIASEKNEQVQASQDLSQDSNKVTLSS